MQLTLTLTMDNAAFGDNTGREAARILHKTAVILKEYGLPPVGESLKLLDANGNTVGTVTVED